MTRRQFGATLHPFRGGIPAYFYSLYTPYIPQILPLRVSAASRVTAPSARSQRLKATQRVPRCPAARAEMPRSLRPRAPQRAPKSPAACHKCATYRPQTRPASAPHRGRVSPPPKNPRKIYPIIIPPSVSCHRVLKVLTPKSVRKSLQ